ncbi:MAG: N-acetylmuramoyl-L-alanine amidase [Candidatus Nanopelagicales bacterium]
MAAIPGVPRPAIVADPIPYGAKRKRQMFGYAWRHYRTKTWRLTAVRQIVLHYTVSNGYTSVHKFFSNNSRGLDPAGSKPESPGNCTHFVVAQSGRIYQQAPVRIMCRQAIGLNHRSIGIEFVEMRSANNIPARKRQLLAGQALVRWLQAKYRVRSPDVIGHAMVNRPRFFVDYEGWRNDHTDWRTGQVRKFHRGLR